MDLREKNKWYDFFGLSLIGVSLLFASCKQGSNAKNVSQRSHKEADINALYAGFYQDPKTLDEQQQNEIIEYAVDNNLPLQRTESGLYYMITEEGRGPNLMWGESIKVHYRGYYLDGQEFDSSYSRGKPMAMQIGQGVPGWNEALTKMKSESKCTVIIPSRLAYSDKGYAGVPPNTIIAFDIFVVM